MTGIDDPQMAASERSGGRSVGEYLTRDPDAVAAHLWASHPKFFGTHEISTDRYVSPDWHRREVESMWTAVWQVACHEREVAEVGNHFVYDVGPLSFLIVRAEKRSDGGSGIKAFYNACLHRGTRLKSCPGRSKTLRCPFHGWTWRLDGELEHVPAAWDFPQLQTDDFGLIEARVDVWGGFVFICPDDTGPSLAEWLGPLPEHFLRLPLEERQLTAHVRREIPCNWKLAQEAFIESYHVTATHPQNAMNTNDLDTQYDILSDNVSRMITCIGVPGPTFNYDLADQEILDSLAEGSAMAMPDGTPFQLGDSGSAREVLTAITKMMWSQTAGADLEGLSAFDLIDGVEYSVFPNFSPWAGLGIPFAYTFTPHGDDPSRCMWDIWVLTPCAEDAEPLPPPPIRVVADDEKFADVEELSWIGPLFDQDMTNLRRMQSGVRTLPKGLTLSAYQESRIRHHHHRLESFVGAQSLSERLPR